MKKNLMSVIILALVFANFVLTAVMVFSVLPQTKSANQMITDVCAAIKLDLNSGAATGSQSVPIDKIEDYTIAASDDKMSINFKSSGDGKDHFLMVAVSLSLNTESDGYTKYGSAGLDKQKNVIKNEINSVIRNHTKEEFDTDMQAIQDEILEYLQDTFGKDFIISVNFSDVVEQ